MPARTVTVNQGGGAHGIKLLLFIFHKATTELLALSVNRKKLQPEKDPQQPAHRNLPPWVSAPVRYQGTCTEVQDPVLELRLPHLPYPDHSVTEGNVTPQGVGVR